MYIYIYIYIWVAPIRGNNYLFKIYNKSTREWCQICSKLTMKIPERRH